MHINTRRADTPRDIIEHLHAICGKTVADTMSNGREVEVARLYLFLSELESWNAVLSQKPESALFSIGQREYVIALLNLCQGQYRNAFKGLRLALELYLQGTLLSVNLISLHEWLASSNDTKWAAIVDIDNGVFSTRFCDAFFPELSDKARNFGTMAQTLYRELSECTHGNMPNAIPMPDSLVFDEEAFDMWKQKATTTKLVIHFALATRYLKIIATEDRTHLEHFLQEELGHIRAIRGFLGGPEA